MIRREIGCTLCCGSVRQYFSAALCVLILLIAEGNLLAGSMKARPLTVKGGAVVLPSSLLDAPLVAAKPAGTQSPETTPLGERECWVVPDAANSNAWRYKAGDDMRYALLDWNDSGWNALPIALDLNDMHTRQSWGGRGWFRLHIVIDSVLRNRSVALQLWQMGASELYLNGRLVKKFGTIVANEPREVRYNPQGQPFALQFGSETHYVLAVRYSNYAGGADYERYGKFADRAGILMHIRPLNNAVADHTAFASEHTVKNLFACGLLAALTLLHWCLFIFYPRQKVNLWYSLFTATLLVRFLVIHAEVFSTNPALAPLLHIAPPLYTSVLVGFYLAFLYTIFYPTMPRAIWGVAAACVLNSALLLVAPKNIAIEYCWLGFMTLGSIEGLRVVIKHGILKKQPGSWILGVGVLDFVVMWVVRSTEFVVDISPVLSWEQFATVVVAGYLGIPIAMSVYIALAFAKTNRHLADQVLQVRQLSDKTLEQERLASEQAMRQKLLEADNARKTRELEEARTLQLSMLPRAVPEHPLYDVAAYMRTATEVGGDYYDFKVLADGTFVTAIGDATGHGMKAGFLVSTTKSYVQTLASDNDTVAVLGKISHGIRNMNLRGMYMCLALVKCKHNTARIAVAGMPPVLHYRSTLQAVEQWVIKALPLGSVGEFPYTELTVPFEPDDILLLMSDGLPELFNAEQEMLGYERIKERFSMLVREHSAPSEIVEGIKRLAEEWSNGAVVHDDMTIVVLRAKSFVAVPQTTSLAPTKNSNGNVAHEAVSAIPQEA